MKVHFLHPYLQQPAHPISIALIGCGGTGSNLITKLAMINTALQELEHPGIHVTVFDDDIISKANIGRQLFSPSEIGLNKAIALVSRINRFFGFNWTAVPRKYNEGLENRFIGHNIVVSCVDSAKARKEIAHIINSYKPASLPETILYWMDTGNTKNTGQVIFGSINEIKQPDNSEHECINYLPNLIDLFPDFEDHDVDVLQGPSCSLAQALKKQDLFINATIANAAGDFLWKALKNRYVTKNGCFINNATMRSNPINL